MRSFTYSQLMHNFSVVITAGVDPNNYTAFLPNNIQARFPTDQWYLFICQKWPWELFYLKTVEYLFCASSASFLSNPRWIHSVKKHRERGKEKGRERGIWDCSVLLSSVHSPPPPPTTTSPLSCALLYLPAAMVIRTGGKVGSPLWEDLSCNVHFRIVSRNSVLPGVILRKQGGGALPKQAEAGRERAASGSRSRTESDREREPEAGIS